MNDIPNNLQKIHCQIDTFAKNYNRNKKDISMLIATKTQTISNIKKAIDMKEKNFGENYVQEGIEKIQYFKKTIKYNKLIWHYIGSIQSNKTRYIAEYFDWCHTIDNAHIAYRLNKQRPTTLPPLNVLIQINIDSEPTKSGIHPNQLKNLSNIINIYPRLHLRGIMCIPKHETKFHKQLVTFNNMKKIFDTLKQTTQNIDTLSMGMSDDIEAAISAGSTLIRIGKAIFKKKI
ncbi:YggS family pyridoxal phosphate-dependent enzyme [Blochmannia endosymbiont of Polyrhachis (Hedomyrma) turneri]|uniref:YggS family pyridoxal phosphate-dependent enzyme n=1 Tax=Blochmannia endosymbiont of Polyrhachis (Hedomyrma) turneri TaxID=1505596 RepID=UPI00061A756D|nr:YggS family pyridoxal phosphate-dependent enzyme [Blochmannia endosymbiont of Polyrhachis (Hedomyrma) turneri]AKC59820.1 UPF0001 protein yggS [Blochmannia endosymbiont of Polyrhachis (Hedomyrma) turneri]